jgi:DNA-binding transcriptional MerR regulator
MDKAPDAYRTISEVGDDLDIAQHVLRFWETRFPQIKPLKRGGGRRYYRPDDVELLKGIRHLLYREGYTIKGVQRILKEQGVKAVQAVGREGGLVPGLGPASPEDAFEDFASAAPLPGHYGLVEPPAPPPSPLPPPPLPMAPPARVAPQTLQQPSPPPEPVFERPAGLSPRFDERQVSFTRGGLGARPASPLPVEPPAMAEAPALPPPHPSARQALLEALTELETARATIGRVLANRDRLSSE